METDLHPTRRSSRMAAKVTVPATPPANKKPDTPQGSRKSSRAVKAPPALPPLFAKPVPVKKTATSKKKILPKKKTPPKKTKKELQKQQLRKALPTTLEDSEGNEVWIANLLAADIQRANKTGRHPWKNKKRQYLHKVPSPSHRHAVYERTARAWEDLEESLLPTYGGRKWQVKITIKDPVNKKGHTVSPFFCFFGGELELAVWPHWLLSIPTPPRFPGYTKRKNVVAAAGGGADDDEEEDGNAPAATAAAVDDDEGDDDWEELQTREVSPLSELAMSERWRVPAASYTIRWISPLRESFGTRKSAWEHAKELCQQEVFLDKMLHGFNANGQAITKITTPSANSILKAGNLRFLRDGLWVIGQEEEWQQVRQEEVDDTSTKDEVSASGARKLSPLAFYLQEKRKMHQARRLKELTDSSGSGEKISFSLRQAETELRVVWKNLREDERCHWAERAEEYLNKASTDDANEANTKSNSKIEKTENPESFSQTVSRSSTAATSVTDNVTPTSLSTNDTTEKLAEAVPQASVIQSAEIDGPSPQGKVGQSSFPSGAGRVTPSSESGVSHDHESEDSAYGDSTGPPKSPGKPTPLPDAVEKSKSAPILKHKRSSAPSTKKTEVHSKRTPSSAWCLNPDQTKLCYDAGIEHYDRVIDTVKARDLAREFQDGFDVLRERGRGRFDMELPAFDAPDFNFLTNPKMTPWMPVVQQILGKDVVLIHKGMFLSLPGSETQKYHQDGPHLTTQYQKPCHAINVFIPLIDLNMQSGPTEFCLGTHILGKEDYDEEFVETPVVKAGTPVIFDYRLGHKGLANTSNFCRPIVYCTYAAAADGKEFKDSVNFSRKRYHKIGSMVDKSLTREERAQKRQRVLDAEQLDKAIELSSEADPIG